MKKSAGESPRFLLRHFRVEHFSRKVGTGFPQENATKQKLERFPIPPRLENALETFV
jgi:hypothetical protein